MALRINNIIVDGLTADPAAPEDGEMWFRSDLKEWRIRKNGQTKKVASKGTDADNHDVPKCKIDATVAPTATDDSSQGYQVGSCWVDVTADKAYICVDDTATAAVWKETTVTGGGGDLVSTNNLSDVANASTALSNLGGEPSFAKNTAFNKNFGTTAGTVSEGNHTHTASQITDFDTEVSNNTSVTANTAKVSFPEAPNDGQEYVRKNQAWAVASGGGGGANRELISFGAHNGPDLNTAASAYETKRFYSYGGSTSYGAPTKITALVKVQGGTTSKVRVYDSTNALVIAELTGISNTSYQVLDLGTISNIPTGSAAFELQIAGTGAQACYIACMTFEY